MSKISYKYNPFITREELPDLLRSLADSLEGKSSDIPEEYACLLSDFYKLKMTIKEEEPQTTVRIKVHTRTDALQCSGAGLDGEDGTSSPRIEDSRHSYQGLKKRMKGSFKLLYKAVHENAFPPEAAVELFIEDSKSMTGFKGYGDEYYADYNTTVDNLEAAWKSQNLEEFHKAVDELNHLKTMCHDRYK
ncbi:MAG: GAK system XXXCH domain-containing protein [Desulfovibrio sp.]